MSLSISQPLFWLYLINITLVLLVTLHMLYQRRSPQNLMSWILALILLPYIGVFLYLLFGSRKFLHKHYKPKISMQAISPVEPENSLAIQLNKVLRSNDIAGATNHNQVDVYHQDTQAFEQLMLAIQNAKTHIHIETYIFELDSTGKKILDALIEKAEQGVEVCLLMDTFGSLNVHFKSKHLQKLKQAGGSYAFFQPILSSLLKGQVNLRNHRKIYLFDQKTLLTGGMNLTDDYLGPKKPKGAEKRWIDLMFKIRGPITFHYQNIFNADWHYATSEKLSEPPQPNEENTLDGETMQAVPAGPDIDSDALYETLLHSIYFAKKTIQIATPYFIPDQSIMNALLIAVKRDVKVSVLTPESSDHLIFDLGRSSYMRELIEAGGTVHYYKGNMLHSKLIIIDQMATIIGSANFDYRSLFINHEIVNFIYSKPLIETLSNWLDEQIQYSELYQPSPNRANRLLENLSRIVAPIL